MPPLRAKTGSEFVFTVDGARASRRFAGFEIGPDAARQVDSALVAGLADRRDQHFVAEHELIGMARRLAVIRKLERQRMPDGVAVVAEFGGIGAEESLQLLAKSADAHRPR